MIGGARNGGSGDSGSREGGARRPASRMAQIERAEALAIDALAWLAGDGERLERFLAASGLDPADLRRAAAAPGFAAGVLDYLCSDEPALIAFADHAQMRPEAVAAAQALLSGPPGGEDW
jgi:hypothetical protein